jgi:antitoxin ParD1/3/4
MNVSLTPELENLVNEQVKSGLYNSASEVIRESLRLFKEQLILKDIRRNELRREIMLGVEAIRNGDYVELKSPQDYENFAEKIIKEGREEYAKRNAK